MKRSIYPSESAIQQAIVEWANNTKISVGGINGFKIGDFLLAIPNGGYRNKYEALKLKNEGVKAGASDLFLAIPISPWCGLWGETKSLKGKLSALQREWFGLMEIAGYRVSVFHSIDKGIQAFKDYLGMK